MHGQRPLTGQWRHITTIGSSGRVEAYLIHRPHAESPFASALLGHVGFTLNDEELLAQDIEPVLERTLLGTLYTPYR